MLELRPYQRSSLDALYAYWQGGGGNGLIVLPTGAGKSLVIAKLVQELLESWPDLRICIVTHVRELVQQNMMELLRTWPGAPVGIYSAGLGRRDIGARVLFCGIQSVWNKAHVLGSYDVVIVDEAHLIPRNSSTMYGKFLDSARAAVPDMRIVGLTATPYRLDSGRLDRGDDKLFDDIVYDANVADLIRDGYLSQLISKGMASSIDTSKVAVRGGEFVPGSLQAAALKPGVVEQAVSEMIGYGRDRKAWLAFCTGIEHAIEVRDELHRQDVTAEAVHGEMDASSRDRAIAAFRAGEIRCLTSVAVLTTGFNVPHVDMIAMLRPTLSAGLYVQIVGRGFRLAPGKENCLILDFAGNVRRHGPVDDVTIKEPGQGGGEAPVKECPECHSLIHAAHRCCPDCGYVFPVREEPNHEAEADAQTAILSRAEPQWIEVTGISFHRHDKEGAPPSLRVEYRCGLIVHREWLALERDGYPRERASSTWLVLGGEHPVPRNVENALLRARRELRAPSMIRVRPNGRFFEVVGRRMPVMEAA